MKKETELVSLIECPTCEGHGHVYLLEWGMPKVTCTTCGGLGKVKHTLEVKLEN